MNHEKLRKYAEVVIRRGLFLKEGQPLYIEALLETSGLVCELAKEAYRAGASDVAVSWKCNELDNIKLTPERYGNKINRREIGKLTELDYAAIDYYAGQGAAFLRIESPDLEIFKDVPTEAIQQKAIADRQSRVRYSQKGGRVQTCIICAPTLSWAAAVYPELPAEEALEKLWEAVFTCVRVNEPDPIRAWDDFIAAARLRRKLLNEKHYMTFHYKSSVTNLYISPQDEQFWGGGCADFPDSEDIFVPNIPTEEVFTAPHKYKVNGYVTSTMPLNFRGRIIRDFKLIVKDGKVIDYHAKEGEDVLKSILETDAGSCYFGEMALIDKNSPISRLNTIFYTTLYDENASCHLALGLCGGHNELSEEEKDRLGINTSILHVDFMVGSADLNIRGQLADGTWEDVFINGSWAPAFVL